jgi:NAD-dependent dihydropyrimidine dehydrogenase PreA subunit
MSETATTHDGMFINVELADSATADAELAAKLAEVCPVDIFTNAGGRVEIVTDNLDECVLCELCIRAAPAGAIQIVKLYSGETLPA